MITAWWWLALVVAAVSASALALAARVLAREGRELGRVTAQVRAVRAVSARRAPEDGAAGAEPVPGDPGGA